MKSHLIITLDELHLIQAIIKKAPVLCGLEEFAMNENRIPDLKTRDSLVNKGILIRNGERFSIDPAIGYMFSTLASNPPTLSGNVVWDSSHMARLNIYILETSFAAAYCSKPDCIEFIFLPTVPLLIGFLCAFIRNRKKYYDNTDPEIRKVFAPERMAGVILRLEEALERGIEADCCLEFESVGNLKDWNSDRYVLMPDKQDHVYYSEPDKDGGKLRMMTLAESLAPINNKLLTQHIINIRESGDLDEPGRVMRVNKGENE